MLASGTRTALMPKPEGQLTPRAPRGGSLMGFVNVEERG